MNCDWEWKEGYGFAGNQMKLPEWDCLPAIVQKSLCGIWLRVCKITLWYLDCECAKSLCGLWLCDLLVYFAGCWRQPGGQLVHWSHSDRVEGPGAQAPAPVQVPLRPHPRLRPLRPRDSGRHRGQQDRGVLHDGRLCQPCQQHQAELGELPGHPHQPGCPAHQEASSPGLRERGHQAVSLS